MASQLNLFKDAAVVIGGVNMDICGRPAAVLSPGDSCPGTVRLTPGGVGRNIAHDLQLLGMEVSLVAAFGDDLLGQALMASCREAGLDLSFAPVVPGGHSSTYLYITDADGEMRHAVNDMEVCSALSPDFFERLLPQLRDLGAMVLDANLPEESLAFLCRRARLPLYADAVSAAKAPRLREHLRSLRVLKANALEAMAITEEKDAERAARRLAKLCRGRVYVSMGADGLFAAERDKLLYLPVYETDVVNTNGAGDAATAAVVWADLRGLDLETSAQFAQLAGSITCRCEAANSPDLAALPHLL